MASPIQIILNPENFETMREMIGGGPKKDFFEGRDDAYCAHKESLVGQLTALAQAIENQRQGDIGIIRVILRREAWAKSHRPVRVLFKTGKIPLVGGGDLGEMYFEARPDRLRTIAEDIGKTEERTNLKFDEGMQRWIPNPSTRRSEAGAIASIELFGPSDRRKFSTNEAVGWLANPMTGGSYHVELFEIPPPSSEWDATDAGRRRVYKSFIDGLSTMAQGLTVQRLQTPGAMHPLLAFRLASSTAVPILQLQGPTSIYRRERSLAPFSADLSHHRRLLEFLDHHPLVRRIDLPPILTRTIVEDSLSARSSAG